MFLEKELVDRKQVLSTLAAVIKKRLKKAPQGTLRVTTSKHQTRYYHRRSSGDRRGVYLGRDKQALACSLAQKSYDEKLLHTIEQEMNAIDLYLSRSSFISPEQLYQNLSEPRKALVVPAFETDEMFAQRWISVEYQGKEFPEGEDGFLTDKGERVRSKSEWIIANMLSQMGVPYRYEYPINLKGLGTIHPDFMVLNPRLRKEFYWEHLGMIDDQGYARKNIRRLAAYYTNGIYPGEKLLLTAETESNPINISQIKELISHFLL